MQTGELMSVREYLSTSFRPDCDYVDGEVVERNVGEYDHSRLLGSSLIYLYQRRRQWAIEVLPGQRVQVSATRFRVPILSKDDRLSGMQERVKDYLNFGVPRVWILNPETRSAWRCTAEGMFETQELRTENPDIFVPVAALFE